jgi:hypothetical protein
VQKIQVLPQKSNSKHKQKKFAGKSISSPSMAFQASASDF